MDGSICYAAGKHGDMVSFRMFWPELATASIAASAIISTSAQHFLRLATHGYNDLRNAWIPRMISCQGPEKGPGNWSWVVQLRHFSAETEWDWLILESPEYRDISSEESLAGFASSGYLLGLRLRFLLPFWCVQQSPILHHLQSPELPPPFSQRNHSTHANFKIIKII